MTMRLTNIIILLAIGVLALVAMTQVADAARYAYIPNYASNNVTVIDTDTGSVSGFIYGLNSPYGTCVSPDGKWVYVVNYVGSGNGNVTRINASNNSIDRIIPLGSYYPCVVSMSPDGKTLFVGGSSNKKVYLVNLTTFVNTSVTIKDVLYCADFTPDSQYIYASGGANVTVIAVNGTVMSYINCSSTTVKGVVAAPTEPYVYAVVNAEVKIRKISTVSNIIVSNITCANSGETIAISPDGTYVYVTASGYYEKYYTANGTSAGSIYAGGSIYGIGVTTDGKYVVCATNKYAKMFYTSNDTLYKSVGGLSSYPYIYTSEFFTPEMPPIAGFTTDVSSGAAPLTVNINDDSIGGTSWAYSWGDDTENSTTHAPQHVYSSPGVYTIIQTVTNSGGSASASSQVTVTTPPTAGFTVSPTSGAVPLTITVTSTASNATSYQYSWGDGSENSTDANPTHAYTKGATFTIIQTASNTNGSAVTTQQVTAINYTDASFTAAPTTGYYPLAVSFTDISTGVPTSWSWDFGDGNTSTSQNPSHTYYGRGPYTVKLTVTNSNNSDSYTATNYISGSYQDLFAGEYVAVGTGINMTNQTSYWTSFWDSITGRNGTGVTIRQNMSYFRLDNVTMAALKPGTDVWGFGMFMVILMGVIPVGAWLMGSEAGALILTFLFMFIVAAALPGYIGVFIGAIIVAAITGAILRKLGVL